MIGKTILLVEDDARVMRNNVLILKSRGAAVLAAADLAEARSVLAEKPRLDAAAIDIVLPDGSGLEFVREIRAEHRFPILLLTSKSDSHDIISGLKTGADDYLTKPYDLNVFMARVEALLRRAHASGESIAVGPLLLHLIGNQAFCGETDLRLTQKEFGLLLLLAKSEGQTLSSEFLYEKLWHQPLAEDKNTLRMHISRLKKKLADVTDNILIEVSHSEGYCLTVLQDDTEKKAVLSRF